MDASSMWSEILRVLDVAVLFSVFEYSSTGIWIIAVICYKIDSSPEGKLKFFTEMLCWIAAAQFYYFVPDRQIEVDGDFLLLCHAIFLVTGLFGKIIRFGIKSMLELEFHFYLVQLTWSYHVRTWTYKVCLFVCFWECFKLIAWLLCQIADFRLKQHSVQHRGKVTNKSNLSSTATFGQNCLAAVKRWPSRGGFQQQDLSEWIRSRDTEEDMAVEERWPLIIIFSSSGLACVFLFDDLLRNSVTHFIAS